MARSSNLPRHGDAIIESVGDALGGQKFVALAQFQQFLDELGDVVDVSPEIDIDQEVNVNSADISSIRSENAVIRKLLDTAIQLIFKQNAEIDTLISLDSKMNKRINELEQLIHVD